VSELAVLIEGVSKTYGLGPRWPADPVALTTRVARRLRGEEDNPNDRRRQRDRDEEDEDDMIEDDDEEDEVEPDQPARRRVALHDVSLEVVPGGRLALLGPAGAGKTTLLRVLARVTPPTTGRAVVRGRVAPLLELASSMMDVNLTGRANARLIGQLFGAPRQVIDRHLEEIFALAGVPEMVDVRADKLSSRHFRRVGLSTVLHLEPDVLLIDESFIANDPEFADIVLERLQVAVDGGVTLLFAAGDPDVVRPFCDEAVWMDRGQILERGSVDHVASLGPYRRAPRPQPQPQPQETPRPPKPRPERPQMGMEALSTAQAQLVELLVPGGRSYGQVGGQLGVSEAEARTRAHDAMATLVPGAERVRAPGHGAVVDHLLGEPTADPVQVFGSPEARVWGRMVTFFLEPMAPDRLSPYLREAPEGRASGTGALVPAPDLTTAGLLALLEANLGVERTREAVGMATDKALWKGLTDVKWADVAEAAGLPHEEGRMLMDAMAALRRRGDGAQPVNRVLDGAIELLEVRTRSLDGEPLVVVRPGDEAVLEVGFAVRRPDVRLQVMFVVERPENPPLRLSQPEAATLDRAGLAWIGARLPVASLVDGQQRVRVIAAATADGVEERIDRKDAMTFEVYADDVVDDDQGDPALGGLDVAWEVSIEDLSTATA
jgi:ABC-type polysaccharide/polyol phosphate transport system ATPase subunit